MKRLVLSVLVGCMALLGYAQERDVKILTTTKQKTPILSRFTGERLPAYDVNIKLSYYENNGNPVPHGLSTYRGSATANNVTSSWKLDANYKDNELDGAYNYVISDVTKGKPNNKFLFDFKANFSNGRIVDYLKYKLEMPDSYGLNKLYWEFQFDKSNKITYINVKANKESVEFKVEYDDSSDMVMLTGHYKEDEYIKGILMNNKYRPIDEKAKQVLLKIKEGKATLEDLLMEGYAIKQDNNFIEFGLGVGINYLSSIAQIRVGVSLPKYYKFNLYACRLEKVEVIRDINELSSYLDPSKKNNWSHYTYYNNVLYYGKNGKYASESVANEFLPKADSVAKQVALYQLNSFLGKRTNKAVTKEQGYPQLDKFNLMDDFNKLNLVDFDSISVAEEVGNSDGTKFYTLSANVLEYKGDKLGYKAYKAKFLFYTMEDIYALQLVECNEMPTRWNEYAVAKKQLDDAYEQLISDKSKENAASIKSFKAYYDQINKTPSTNLEVALSNIKGWQGELDAFAAFLKYRKEVLAKGNALEQEVANAPDAYKYYQSVMKTTNLEWDENVMERLESLNDLQKHLKLYAQKHGDMVAKDAAVNAAITSAGAKDMAKVYSTYYQGVQFAIDDPNLIVNVEKVIATQDSAIKFAEMRKIIADNDVKLKELGKKGKTLYKAYTTYYKTADQTWSAADTAEKLEKIISVQESCKLILLKENIKDIDKEIKKAKLNELTEIIAKYAQ